MSFAIERIVPPSSSADAQLVAVVGPRGVPGPSERSQHTGTQVAATISDFGAAAVAALQPALGGKSNVGHGHDISDVAALQATLDGKANLLHSHTIADIANLQTSLNARAVLVGANSFSGTQTLTATGADVPLVIDQGNRTNVNSLRFDNMGAGATGILFNFAGGGTAGLQRVGTSFEFFLANRAMAFRVDNNAFDAAPQAYLYQHTQAATRHHTVLQHMQDTNTGDLLRGLRNTTLMFNITATGNAGFGTAAVAGVGVAAAEIVRIRSLDAMARLQFHSTASSTVRIADMSLDLGGNLVIANLTSCGLFLTSFNGIITFRGASNATIGSMSAAEFRPGNDNVATLGAAANRWSTVFAGTGTINTSDEREKTWRGSMTEAERAAAIEIAAELGFFQWNEAIEEKGADRARIHFGVRAQRVWEIMAAHGLVEPIRDGRPGWTPYAFLCFDRWDDQWEDQPGEDEEGKPLEPRLAVAAGSQFGVRHDQLTMFLLSAVAQQLLGRT
jgi:hypothetical protein